MFSFILCLIMIGITCKGTFLHHVLRVFGFFPFSWQLHPKNVKDGKIQVLVLKRSTFWSGWSLVLVVLIPALMAYHCFVSVTNPRKTPNSSSTLSFAHIIYDVLNGVGVFVLQVLGFWNSDVLAQMAESAKEIRNKSTSLTVPPFKHNPMSIILICCASTFSVITVCGFTLLVPHGNIAEQISLTFRCILLAIHLVIFSLLSYAHLEFAANAMFSIYKPFIELTESRKLSDKEKHQASEDAEPKISNKTNKVDYRVNVIDLDAPCNKPLQNFKHFDKMDTVLDGINFDDVRERTLNLFEHLHTTAQYMDQITMAMIVVLVGSLLVTCFYLSMWPDMNVPYKLLIIGHLSITTFPVVYLTNTPTCFKTRVRINEKKR